MESIDERGDVTTHCSSCGMPIDGTKICAPLPGGSGDPYQSGTYVYHFGCAIPILECFGFVREAMRGGGRLRKAKKR